MAGTHSRLSPSGVHRYLRCAPAPSAEEGLPNRESQYAFDGTCLHEIAERCLLDGGDPHRFIGEVFTPPKADMQKYGLEPYVVQKSDCDSMVPDLYAVRDDLNDGEMHVETRVSLDWPLGEGEAGTADIAGRDWRKRIHIKDWKFGEGMVVEAENNEQMSLYGIGAIRKHWPDAPRDTVVYLQVLQPRIEDGGSTWETTVGALMDWAEEVVLPQVELINSENPPYVAGKKQCHWCLARRGDPANGIEPCEAYTQFNMDIARNAFANLDMEMELGLSPTVSDQNGLSPEARVWIYDHSDMLKKWLDEVKKRIQSDLSAGRSESAPGKKLVEGRALARKFNGDMIDEVDRLAVSVLGEAAYDKKLKTPKGLEDELGRETYTLLFADMVEQGRSSPSIVALDNPKPALPTTLDTFDRLIQEREANE